MNARALIHRLSAREARVLEATVLAPWVRGGAIRVRVEGLVRTFRPVPETAEGWSRFRPVSETTAVRAAPATRREIAAYLARYEARTFHLTHRVRGRSWLAMPRYPHGLGRHAKADRPMLVHLVERGARFDAVRARSDGSAWWYEAPDRRNDPRLADELRNAAREHVEPLALRVTGAGPGARAAYAWAFEGEARERTRAAERQIARALATGGGALLTYEDRGDHWLVAWRTPDGERHASTIAKDFTVLSAGICLSGRDADFDLTSLAGVVQGRPDWMR